MNPESHNDLQIWKAIWQVRHPPAALLLDRRGDIANRWQHKKPGLTEWAINANSVRVHDRANTTLLQSELTAATVVVESQERQDIFRDLATEFVIDVLDTLNIRRIERTGLRLIFLAERPNFKALCRKIQQRLFSLGEGDWEVFGAQPEDVGFPLVFRFGERWLNWNFGPMHKGQIEATFDSNEVKGQLPELAVFLDCDLFELAPKIYPKEFRKELGRSIDSGIEQILAITDSFMGKYGGFK